MSWPNGKIVWTRGALSIDFWQGRWYLLLYLGRGQYSYLAEKISPPRDWNKATLDKWVEAKIKERKKATKDHLVKISAQMKEVQGKFDVWCQVEQHFRCPGPSTR